METQVGCFSGPPPGSPRYPAPGCRPKRWKARRPLAGTRYPQQLATPAETLHSRGNALEDPPLISAMPPLVCSSVHSLRSVSRFLIRFNEEDIFLWERL